jgi:Flp pilus assembly pilin Flp
MRALIGFLAFISVVLIGVIIIVGEWLRRRDKKI